MQTTTNTLYLIYDGDCILCRNSAQAVKIKKSVGNLQLINARESHPLAKEALEKGYDLNEGIVIHYHGQYYYGADALQLLALMGSDSDLFNRINVRLFKYKWISLMIYPIFKTIRNVILSLRGIAPLPMPTPVSLAYKIFGEQAKNLPPVLLKRYSNRPYSNDSLIIQGKMNVSVSKIFKILSPLFRLFGALMPQSANNIAATVEFTSHIQSNKIIMNRIFYYADNKPYQFSSKIMHIKNNSVAEEMRFGFATNLIFSFDNNRITMNYGGYLFCLGSKRLPLPFGFLIGKFYAFEEATADDEFAMLVTLTHPLFGKLFQYDGRFKITNTHQ